MTTHAIQRLATGAGALVLVFAGMGVAGGSPDEDTPQPTHGIAMHGELRHQEGFAHFDYVNPDAPAGGRLTIAMMGSFDTLNPLVVRGLPARGIREHVYESLMARGLDEPFSLYGLLAHSVEVPDDRSEIVFHLREEARFSDGEPVTAEDVLFSWELLRDRGRPNHRSYYRLVETAEALDEHTVRFAFEAGAGREMPLIMALMPILPAHDVDEDTFEQGGLRPPIGSGPYTVGEVRPGSSITYERNGDYWGRDLAVTRGLHNFDLLRFEYFRDANAMFEGFRTGLSDVRAEDDPTRWATGYDFPAVRDGRVALEEFDTGLPRPMSAFVFNTRRDVFADERVRRALLQLFNGDWMNQTLYHGLYERTNSFFHGSELSAAGIAADERELAVLGEAAERVDPAILDGSYELPGAQGRRDRASLRGALELLQEAGYALDGGVMRHTESGHPLTFEILVATRDQERLALTYAGDLERAGIRASVRQVDSAQFERRRQSFDYDMIHNAWYNSLSPGSEQAFYWGSEAARTEGSRNYMGVADPAVDRAIEALLAAEDREPFVAATRALDRLLMSGTYLIPLFHPPGQWVARWSHVERPADTSLYGYLIETWWAAPDAADTD